MEDSYNTEDSYETRKRTREEHELVQYPKRINFGTKPGHYLLKMLVPPTVAGSIIGRGGAQIKELQLTYDVVIKLSQNNQFYPERSGQMSYERIVLITGPPDKLVQVAEFIHTLVRNPPQGRGGESDMGLDSGRRQQQMKLIVTNTTAGMIIGKRGETVRSLNDQYDVRIQASQKDDLVMGERVITVYGAQDGVNKVVEYIIKEKFREDPTSSSITNLDYSAYMDPNNMGMGNSMGSTTSLNYGSYEGGQDFNQVNLIQTLLQQNQQNQQQPAQQQAYGEAQQYSNFQAPQQYNNTNSYNSIQGQAGQMQQQQQSPQHQQGSGGANNNQNNTAEVIAKVLQALPSNALSNTNTLASTLMIIQALSGNASNGGGGGGGGGMPQMSQMRQQPMQPKVQLRPFVPRPDDIKFKVEVPDSLVGRILGRQGSTITELQNSSGCEIKFSQRGEYVPGTQNRLLYICGQAAACKTAQSLILAKIEGETGDVSSSEFVFEQIPN